MPIYLAHGFRWPRDGFAGIRVHAIVNDLEDVAAEYIQTPTSRLALLESLRSLYPNLLKPLESGNRRLDFLEQYDPEDVSPNAVSQPYAFVCDWIMMIQGGTDAQADHHFSQLFQTKAQTSQNRNSSGSTVGQTPRVRARTQPMSIAAPFNSPATTTALSMNVEEATTNSPPLSTEAWEAMAELRDKLADGEKIGWWIVYNGDPDREYPRDESEYSDEEEGEVKTEREETSAVGEVEKRSSVVASTQPSVSDPRSSQLNKTFGAGERSTREQGSSANRVRSPTGGRIPPPVPPASTKTPRSLAQPASKPLPIRPPLPNDPERKRSKEEMSKEPPKSPGLRKKLFGGSKKTVPA